MSLFSSNLSNDSGDYRFPSVESVRLVVYSMMLAGASIAGWILSLYGQCAECAPCIVEIRSVSVVTPRDSGQEPVCIAG